MTNSDELVERVAMALSRHMHDSRARAWEEVLSGAQKEEAREAARAAIQAYEQARAALSGSPEG